ncbi:hypothetical protein ACHAXS_007788 [Conticribra weissflogii]
MIEKKWFDGFLTFQSPESDHVGPPPGKIQNAPLLLCDESLVSSDGGSHGEIAAGASSNGVDAKGDSEGKKKRYSRRKKLQCKESTHLSSSSGKQGHNELLGGNAASLNTSPMAAKETKGESPALQPNLRHQSDYVLVGEKTWDLLSNEFSCDVELPLRTSVLKGANGERKQLVVEIYPPQGNDSPSAMDVENGDCESSLSTVVVPESGKWNATAMDSRDDGIDPANSEAGDTTDSGDDLFPTLENDPTPTVSFANPQERESSQIMDIVPYEAISFPDNIHKQRATPKETNIDDETSDEDATSSPTLNGCNSDHNHGVRITTYKRKRATGLGNLGNTCFMNSTLQCLAHTTPLRKYFTSGEFEKDLNKDNPLGTGGELATEFANLLRQMWGMKDDEKSNVVNGDGIYSSSRVYSVGNFDSGLSSVTYPRTFKHTLGKHAEQFSGYDQHDSQELAIYLLDALHEDTNRVTKKPYIEKPEQGEDESDHMAAEKAWGFHLQREDSRILEHFMGQIKSKLECPKEGCGRVSTTFDPCMYLSVPIPGAMDKIMKVTFFPLSPNLTPVVLTIKINKTSTIAAMKKQIAKLATEAYDFKESELLEDDIQVGDVWSGEIYAYYGDDHEVDRIRDSDTTHAYQLRTKESIKEEVNAFKVEQNKKKVSSSIKQCPTNSNTRNSTLDPSIRAELDENDHWQNVLQGFLKQPMSLYQYTNVKRSTHEQRLVFYGKLLRFIRMCSDCQEVKSGDACMGECNDEEKKSQSPRSLSPVEAVADDSGLSLEEACQTSTSFKNVNTPQDLEVFEYCVSKYLAFINHANSPKIELNEDGVVIQLVFKKNCSAAKNRSSWKTVAPPLVMRISPTLTVFGLRQVLARRIQNAINVDTNEPGNASPEMFVMKQVALSYDTSFSRNYSTSKALGSVTEVHMEQGASVLAKSSDDDEKRFLASIVGNEGKIYVGIPARLNNSVDIDRLELREDFLSKQQQEENASSGSNKVTVFDCISKYCQTEQLEESEMWYCNRCKDHVQAWKQFHLYRTPPILIIHLKRFHFSSATHRRNKIDTLIDFPLNDLDLRDVVMHWDDGEEPIYDCYAVSNHFGGLGGGHYTAYARADDGTWSNFDDSRVTSEVDESEVVSPAAYCLYYKRKDVIFDNDYSADNSSKDVSNDEAMIGTSDDGTSQDDMDVDTADHVGASHSSLLDSDDFFLSLAHADDSEDPEKFFEL